MFIKTYIENCLSRNLQGFFDLNCQYDASIEGQTLNITPNYVERKKSILVIMIARP